MQGGCRKRILRVRYFAVPTSLRSWVPWVSWLASLGSLFRYSASKRSFSQLHFQVLVAQERIGLGVISGTSRFGSVPFSGTITFSSTFTFGVQSLFMVLVLLRHFLLNIGDFYVVICVYIYTFASR